MKQFIRFLIRHRFLFGVLLFCAANHFFDGGVFDLVMTVKGQAAGFTTVTGTITDPNGLKYSCGTITAQLITAGGAAPTLNGGGFTTVTSPARLGCPTTPGTGAPGSFLMQLADSGVIVPSNTTWRFTINLAPGIAPPAGTGPQSFSVTTAINCATNTPATCTSNAMDISTLLSASAPAISNSAGGGVTPVATLPPLPCTNNSVVNLTTGAQGIYICINGAWQLDTGGGGSEIFLTAYGVTAAGSEDCSAIFVNTSGTVTLSANAVTPTSSMIGWHMEGSVSCNDGTQGTVMPECTITSVNSGARTLTGTGCAANASATGTATQHAIFGPVEDTQVSAAETGGLSANTGPCPGVQMSSGFVWTDTGHFNSFTCNTQYTGSGSVGMTVQGYGRVNSRFHIGSTFNFATGCPSFGGINTCFFGKNGIIKQNFSITGGQMTGTNPAASTCMVNDGTDDFSFSLGLFGFGNTLANLIGHCMTSLGAANQYVFNDGMGSIGENVNLNSGGKGSCVMCFFGNVSGTSGALDLVACEQYGTWNSTYQALSATNGFVQNNGVNCMWNSVGDNVILLTAGSDQVLCNSFCSLTGWGIFGALPTNSGFAAITSATGHLTVKDSFLSAGATNNIWAATAAGVFDDLGGNIITDAAGHCANLSGGAVVRQFNPSSTYSNPCNFTSGTYVPYRTVSFSCTGTVTASLTTGGVYGTGPNITATACNAAPNNAAPGTLGTGVVMDHAGTLSFFQVTAGTGGTNASSGVFTVMKATAGGALTATTITCTVGTGTSCVDNTHTVSFASGDLISVQYTTQAADTLANIKGFVGAF